MSARVRDTVRLLHVPSRHRHILVVGGGIVAARRVVSCLRRGHRVVVVAPRICDDLLDLMADPGVTWENRAPLRSDLDGAWLMHVVTGDPATDDQVRRWAHDGEAWLRHPPQRRPA